MVRRVRVPGRVICRLRRRVWLKRRKEKKSDLEFLGRPRIREGTRLVWFDCTIPRLLLCLDGFHGLWGILLRSWSR